MSDENTRKNKVTQYDKEVAKVVKAMVTLAEDTKADAEVRVKAARFVSAANNDGVIAHTMEHIHDQGDENDAANQAMEGIRKLRASKQEEENE